MDLFFEWIVRMFNLIEIPATATGFSSHVHHHRCTSFHWTFVYVVIFSVPFFFCSHLFFSLHFVVSLLLTKTIKRDLCVVVLHGFLVGSNWPVTNAYTKAQMIYIWTKPHWWMIWMSFQWPSFIQPDGGEMKWRILLGFCQRPEYWIENIHHFKLMIRLLCSLPLLRVSFDMHFIFGCYFFIWMLISRAAKITLSIKH